MSDINKREKCFDFLAQNTVSLPDTFKILRDATGRTQKQFSQAFKVQSRILSGLENGTANVTIETLERLLAPWNLELTVKHKETVLENAFQHWKKESQTEEVTLQLTETQRQILLKNVKDVELKLILEKSFKTT